MQFPTVSFHMSCYIQAVILAAWLVRHVRNNTETVHYISPQYNSQLFIVGTTASAMDLRGSP